MRKSIFVSIGWMVCLLGMALSALAQTARVVDLNGQGVEGVLITANSQCFDPKTNLPVSSTTTAQSDSSGGFTWPGTCFPSGGATTYTLTKTGYRFTHDGVFGVNESSIPVQRGDTRVPFIYAVSTTITRWTAVSAADYDTAGLANGMIGAGFGSGIAATTAIATLPLPTTLGARKIVVRDVNGKEAAAQFLFISPNQINFIMPSGLAEGACAVKLLDSGDNVRFVDLPILRSSRASLFTANADGKGVPAALILRVKPGNVQTFEPLAQYDQQQKKWVPLPIDLGPSTESVFLVLYGTGWRNFPAGSLPTVKLADVECEVTYSGSQLVLAGLDQINARIPRSLVGRGDVLLTVSFITSHSDSYLGNSGLLSWPLKIK